MSKKLCMGLVILVCLTAAPAWAGPRNVRPMKSAGLWWALAADLVDLVERWMGFSVEKTQGSKPSGGSESLDCTVSIDPNGACQPVSGSQSDGTAELDCHASIDPDGACRH